MASIGRVAAAVAHDFNKLMSVVLSKAQSIVTAPGLPAVAAEDARVLVDAVRRSGALTRQVAELGGAPREDVGRLLHVDVVVNAATDVLRALAGEGRRVEVSLGAGDAAVRVDRVRFDQILTNLVSNALDVTGEGGEIRIGTSVRAGLDGTWVEVHVTDHGAGIDQATRPHIFEPYFTTKGERGCGLGLAIVYAVVQRAGGFISVDSVAGRGTTFTVHLPAARDV
jgi:two-component system cell cycle sensor histidine kinase/response regulator CckA